MPAQEIVFAYRDGLFVPEAGPTSRPTSEMLADLLKANPGIKTAAFEELARDKGLGRNRARQFLDEGVEAGRIRRDKREFNTRAYTWIGG